MNKTPRNAERKLSADDMLQISLDLMERLTADPLHQVDAGAFARDLGISPEQTGQIVELLQGLADEQTGSRIALDCQDDVVSLNGDAGRLDPVRLTPAESLALRRVLTHCSIAEDVRERVEKTLCADSGSNRGAEDEKLMGGDRLLGGFYPIISEAIAIGGRLEISYRAGDETEPKKRLVDPKLIEVSGDAAYLIAWNIEKDAQRSYRLDRMADVVLTDDSVETHDFEPYRASESLRAHGTTVTLRFADETAFALRDWEGIHRDEVHREDDGHIVAEVSSTSKPWLFSQVAAAAGAIEIAAPMELRSEFKDWARAMM